MKLYNKTCLVAGGAGFIGRHLCEKLLQNNNFVICLDSLITGSTNNINDFLNHHNFIFISADITNIQSSYINDIIHIDEIYNFACIASPDTYKEHSIYTLDTCYIGSKNLIELALKHKAKYIFASTSEVYGDPHIHPQPESYYGNVNTVGERSCYDEGKRVAETLVYEYHYKMGLNAKIIRSFNTDGPYMSMNDGRVITNFIKNILENKPIIIYGNGEQTRSFCYIDDLVDGIFKMMETPYELIGPINLGNPNCEFTINHLVDVFQELFENKITVEYRNATQDDPKQRKPDITKARELLRFEPKINIKDGLQKMIQHYRV